jgi:hypothetical protein
MSLQWAIPFERVFLLNPSQALDVGDRLPATAVRQSLDHRLPRRPVGALFSSDCFGAPMPSAELATATDVRAAADQIRDLQLLWVSVDSPWVHQVHPAKFRATVDPIRAMGASGVFCSHLPPVPEPDDRFLETVLQAPETPPFVGPDQAALEALLATFEPA